MILFIPLGNLLLIIITICLASSEENLKDCQIDDINYGNQDEWETKCMKHRCKLGSLQSTFNKSCCQAGEGGVYMMGEAWSNGCWINRCKDGSVDSLLSATCCRDDDGVHNNNSTWEDECWRHTCLNGDIKKELKPNMCCTIGKNTFKNKEFWYKGEVLYTCEHGTEEKSLNHEGTLSLQLPSVPEVLSNDLEMNKRKRRSPANKINCWDQEQALEILCHSWNARCYIKKCHRGQLTYQVDLKCCEIDGVAYPDGVAWSEKCLLYFCEAGAARKQSDSSCCSYCGEKYPHGHEWDEEEEDCYEKVCRSGTVKREMKKSCCKHDGEIYRNGEYWQTRNHMWICFDGEKEKIDDSDEYCKFDNKIYRTGEGWIKECAIYTCEKGCISSRMDTACKGLKKCGNECDYDTDDYGLEINEVCASFGGPCTIGQGQGVCRPRCSHGEVPLGQCDGRACICCGPIANGANYIPLLNLNTTNNIDHNTIISGLDINEVCASQGGPCNTEQGQGVCRPSCGPGEVGLGQCDGRSCICCGPIANGDNSIPLLSLNTAISIDHNAIIQGLEMNELCASQGGPCNTEQGQGVCRPSCGPGEVGLGQCDGQACICCGPIANGSNSIPLLSLNTAINIDNNTITSDTQQSCTVDGKILGSGRSIVVQEKCLTYMCNNGILLEAKMENC